MFHVPIALASVALAGCYAQFGMGYSGKEYATMHASAGLVAHFGGERAAMRVGAGAAAGGYEPAAEGARRGTLYPGPGVLGGHVRILGDRDALVASVDAHAPWGGHLSFRDPDESETAHGVRVFAGLGYRHSWRGRGAEHELADVEPREREGGAVIVAVGQELFWGESTNSAKPSDATYGVAASATFTIRARVIGEMLDCLISPRRDDCE